MAGERLLKGGLRGWRVGIGLCPFLADFWLRNKRPAVKNEGGWRG